MKIVDPDVFQVIDSIIADPLSILYFTYERQDGTFWNYRRVRPRSWLFMKYCYFYCIHELHPDPHYFRVDKISNVRIAPNILGAIMNPHKYDYFWNGVDFQYDSVPV